MVQAAFRMLWSWTLGLACLVFGCTTVYESSLGTNAASINHSRRTICLETENDIHKAVCCENHLHLGSNFSCCGEKAFNPAAATCCKVEQGDTIATHVTEGLSQEVSSCCGLKVYNSLNETCCNKTVVAKPGPNVQCCDEEAYDPDKQMCCGKIGIRKILTRESSHQRCCGQNQYDRTTHCCCPINETLQIELISSSCCVNKSAHVTEGLSQEVSSRCGLKVYNSLNETCCNKTVVAKPGPNVQCCDEEAYDPDKQMCCGKIGIRKILTRESSHQRCCGQNQYDRTTHCCCPINETLQIELISSSCCVNKSAHVTEGLSQEVSSRCGLKVYNSLNETCCNKTVVAKPGPNVQCCDEEAYDPDKQMCCGKIGIRKILTRESSHQRCCGQNQYDRTTHCCCPINETLQIELISSSCCVNKSAHVTEGLSQEVSSRCGLKVYNSLNETCCNKTVVAKPGPNVQCCDEEAYDPDKQMCCGKIGIRKILTRESSHQRCCGQNQYDRTTHCCCPINETLQIELISSSCCVNKSAHVTEGLSQEVSSRCGLKVYNSLNETCCNKTVVAKTGPNVQCCDEEAYDPDKQMCCGKIGIRKILTRESSHQQCCGQNQYDLTTHCCCPINETLQIELISSSCCVNKSGVQQQKTGPQPNCTEAQTSLCGSSCYDPHEFRCCERNQTKCAPVSKFCGRTPYGLAQHRALCRTRTEVDGKECLKINAPYNPVKWTTCCFQLHGSPGHHCCGTEVYQNDTEICCDGHRHPKDEGTLCCGIHAYHSKNRQKCCAGTLYNLSLLGTLGHEARCCGSTLQKAKDVCCKSPVDQPGHHQKKMIKESRLESVNNLNETDLCEEMLVGTVEMVCLHRIVFSNVMKIHGRNGIMNPVALTHNLSLSDRCNSPKVFPGKTYSFDEVSVFIDFNHDSILQSIHFIMSKCYRR